MQFKMYLSNVLQMSTYIVFSIKDKIRIIYLVNFNYYSIFLKKIISLLVLLDLYEYTLF